MTKRMTCRKKPDYLGFFAYSEPKKFYMKTVDEISPFQTQNKTRTGVFENSRDSKDLRADLKKKFRDLLFLIAKILHKV